MGERVLRRLELLEEAAGDGEVPARALRVERLDRIARRLRRGRDDRGRQSRRGSHFIQVKYFARILLDTA